MSYQENLKVIEITKAKAAQVRAEYDQLSLKRNSQLSEIISDLTGIKNISTQIGIESTTVRIHYGQQQQGNHWRTHDISIYHRRDYDFKSGRYNKDLTFELSWFSTSFKFDDKENAPGYVDYLNCLGLLANSINNNGTIKSFILESIDLFKPLNKEINELDRIVANNELANSTLINNGKRFDVAQACARDLDIEINEHQHYYSRRSSRKINAVRVIKRTKKMVHYEMKEIWTDYERNEKGECLFDENGNYKTIIRNEFHGLTGKMRFDDFESFIFQNWPKTFDDYKAEVEAKLIQN